MFEFLVVSRPSATQMKAASPQILLRVQLWLDSLIDDKRRQPGTYAVKTHHPDRTLPSLATTVWFRWRWVRQSATRVIKRHRFKTLWSSHVTCLNSTRGRLQYIAALPQHITSLTVLALCVHAQVYPAKTRMLQCQESSQLAEWEIHRTRETHYTQNLHSFLTQRRTWWIPMDSRTQNGRCCHLPVQPLLIIVRRNPPQWSQLWTSSVEARCAHEVNVSNWTNTALARRLSQ